MKKVGIFIPGRLESQRLPNKLILPLGETNLWDIACKKLETLSDKYNVYVLCHDEELINIASKYKLTIIKRAPETTTIEGPFKEIFKDLKDVKDDYLMFLNPCLYNLKVSTIEKAIEYFIESEYSSMTSVKEFKNWLYRKDGHYLLETDVNKDNWSTKEVYNYYEAAHCFHVCTKTMLFEDNKMLDDFHDCFIIDKEETLDIDTKQDYDYARWRFENEARD